MCGSIVYAWVTAGFEIYTISLSCLMLIHKLYLVSYLYVSRIVLIRLPIRIRKTRRYVVVKNKIRVLIRFSNK